MMSNPKLHLRVKSRVSVSGKPNSKAETIVKQKGIEEKELQLSNANRWCQENIKRGHAALKTGLFPLIKDRGTIDRRLDGTTQRGTIDRSQIRWNISKFKERTS